jgi:microcystin-dependent protein
MAIEATVTVGTLDPALCTATYQELLQSFVDVLTITFPINMSVFFHGDTPPDPSQITDPPQVWIKTDASNNPIGVFEYVGSQWLMKHPLPPGSIMLYKGTAASIVTFDGGEANGGGGAPTTTTGQMWAIVTELSGKFPLGVSNDHAEASTGGAETVTLDSTEMPAHVHPRNEFNDPEGVQTVAGTSPGILSSADSQSRLISSTGSAGGDPNDNDTTAAHDNMPPYYSLYFIVRTARLYYRS